MIQGGIFQSLSKESKQIFQLIQKKEEITKKELCALTNNNITTLNRFFQPLEQADLVIESGAANSCGGRRPVLYTVNPHRHYFGAVNISSTYYEVAIVNLKLDVVAIQHFTLTKADMPDMVMEKIADVLGDECQKANIQIEQLHGIGISIFSTFNHRIGKIGRPINLYLNEEWIGYSLEEHLQKLLTLPIVIENSTAAVALLEYFYGVGKEAEKMIYVLCSMNIRSMAMNQGTMLSDTMFYEDAFGHSTVDFDGLPCACGNYGCVNCYATIPAILNSVNGSLKAGIPTILKREREITIAAVCRGADEGDAVCIQAITFAATMLGIGLANYINMVRPNLVVLSGILVNESNLYYEVCVATVMKRLNNFISQNQIKFLKSGKFPSPLIAGAGSIMIEKLLK